MAEIKVDLPSESLTVKTRRNFIALEANNENERISVSYDEIKYTGTIGANTYKQITKERKIYNADWAKWLASDAGAEIQAGLEAELATDVPGSTFVEPTNT